MSRSRIAVRHDEPAAVLRPYLLAMWLEDRHLTEEEREGVELLLDDPMIVDWLRLPDAETDTRE